MEDLHLVAEVGGRLAGADRQTLELEETGVVERRPSSLRDARLEPSASACLAASSTMTESFPDEAAWSEEEEDDEADVRESNEREDPRERGDRGPLLEQDPRREHDDVEDLCGSEERDEQGRCTVGALPDRNDTNRVRLNRRARLLGFGFEILDARARGRRR
jgi:hypothetical protein